MKGIGERDRGPEASPNAHYDVETGSAKAIKTMEGRQQLRTSAFADQDAKTLGKKRNLEGDYLLSAAASHESSSRRSAQSGRRAAVEAKLRRQSTNARVI